MIKVNKRLQSDLRSLSPSVQRNAQKPPIQALKFNIGCEFFYSLVKKYQKRHRVFGVFLCISLNTKDNSQPSH